MGGHHLVLGETEDFITGDIVEDSHDERYRQKLARLLVTDRGFAKNEIIPRNRLALNAGENIGVIRVDFRVELSGRIGMILKYAPGSLVTRHRPALAISRLMAPYQIPVVVVTNGEDADVLDGTSCKQTGSGFGAIPSRDELVAIMANADFSPVPEKRAALESRIAYCYEIDGACPCDTNICRL
ncbi:hypothetical protein DENIS_3342 [Desulfonema ishimotonii]|uniref:Type I restriction enzyme R protein N-terminal domain-containing protein n=1 Tax=Desulfonema ishimotonii TaxID=45657 RepID=A0A401FZI6_9BACT|nr:type I restriction enzyme HsdR N-terminal domain-containing protein [Desulfonema ishimotonii]GBC62370.1 hypothetical protein DENIS_3342 [Desulfonema ishimotonii]